MAEANKSISLITGGKHLPRSQSSSNTPVARTTPIERYRNIGIMAHIDAGKTTTTERVLFLYRRIAQDGRGARWQCRRHGLDGTGAGARHHDYIGGHDLTFWSRYGPALARAPGQHHRYTRDTLILRSRSNVALRVLDGADYCALFRGWRRAADRDGLAPGATSYNVPRMVFINKMDRAGAELRAGCQSRSRNASGANPVPIQLPIGAEENFEGVIDLVRMKAIRWNDAMTWARRSSSTGHTGGHAFADVASQVRASIHGRSGRGDVRGTLGKIPRRG